MVVKKVIEITKAELLSLLEKCYQITLTDARVTVPVDGGVSREELDEGNTVLKVEWTEQLAERLVSKDVL